MFRFVAFLRAINVGGGRTVKMQTLRQVFESLGFSGVATFIASGNVVFETNYRPFPQSKFDETWQSNIIFLADNLNEKLKQKVEALRTNTDEFEVCGEEIYWRRRRKPNGALFSTVPLEKILGPTFTVRGANTIKRSSRSTVHQRFANVRHHTTRPNQLLAPTAGRRDADVDFVKQFSILAMFVPASGGSGLSR
jgi:uncharacterized protein (DUF1697 family)